MKNNKKMFHFNKLVLYVIHLHVLLFLNLVNIMEFVMRVIRELVEIKCVLCVRRGLRELFMLLRSDGGLIVVIGGFFGKYFLLLYI